MENSLNLKNINTFILSKMLSLQCNCEENPVCVIESSIENCPFKKECKDVTMEDWKEIIDRGGL